MPASLHDVAKLVGVSISTVSRALHRPDMVDAATRERVQAGVDALGYVPQGAGRALVSRQTRTVGAVIPQIGASTFIRTIEALRQRLGDAGYTLLLAQPMQEQAGADTAPLRALIERGVDAAVLLGGPCPPRWKELVQKSHVPLVTIWADAAGAQRRGIRARPVVHRLRQQQRVALVAKPLAQRLDAADECRRADLRDDRADGARLPRDERASRALRHVAQRIDARLHALARGRIHHVRPVQGARHGADGDADELGDVLQAGGHDANVCENRKP